MNTDNKPQVFKDATDFTTQFCEECESIFSKTYDELNDFERYYALASLIAGKARNAKVDGENDEKQVYYFSLEFLIGPLLDNYLLNFGVRDIVKAGCEQLGTPLEELVACEADPGLGNGGLGLLAA